MNKLKKIYHKLNFFLFKIYFNERGENKYEYLLILALILLAAIATFIYFRKGVTTK